jgi:histidinol-phosphate aminotransferase
MKLPVRDAIVASPDYPFVPIEARIKLDQNESPEDLPDALKDEVLKRLAALPWNRYPDMNSDALASAISRHEGWHAHGVVVATGSNVLIPLLIQLAALSGRVLTVKPNFALYSLDARLLGTDLEEVPLRADYTADIDALAAAMQRDLPADGSPAGIVVVPRPHAPTGSLSSLDELERLARLSDRWVLVIDEAYHQFAGPSAIELARRFPNVVLLRTFSKAWGLAGARLGYALASDPIARQLRKLVAPFAVSVLQTVCAEVALAHPEVMQERVARAIRERERMFTALQAHPTWIVLPSAANFLLIKTPDAAAAHAALLAAGILVRRQDSYFNLAGCIRVSVGTPAENDAFLAAAGVA